MVFADPVVANLFGISSEQGEAGQPILRFLKAIHPDDLDRVSAAISSHLESGCDYCEQYRVVAEAGKVSIVLAMGRCFRDKAGTPLEYTGMIFDLTARSEAEPEGDLITSCGQAFRAAKKAGNGLVAYLISMALIELGRDAARQISKTDLLQ